jgi:thiol-disulfide isomerase/thioredoxin
VTPSPVSSSGVTAASSPGSVSASPASSRSASALLAFHGTAVGGKPFDGASLAGKPVVLWFWAPWCPTCLMQAPGVRAAVERSGGSVNVVGVAGLDTAAAMPEFVQLAKVGSMTHVADEAGALWKQYGVTEQSYFVFLDATGAETFRGKLNPDDIAPRVAQLVS